MAEKVSPDNRPLDDVMLAMDVVDTLRYRGSLLERELAADDRDRRLIERLRAIYESQGIDVPDRVLAEGVAALREERFAYRPPQPGLKVRLARIYVERGKWTRRTAIALGIIGALCLLYHLAVVRPRAQRLAAQVADLNRGIVAARDRLDGASRTLASLRAELGEVSEETPGVVADRVAALAARASRALDEAETLRRAAEDLAQPADLTVETLGERGETARGRLGRQEETVGRVETLASTAGETIASTGKLRAAAARASDAWRTFEESSPPPGDRAVGEAVRSRLLAALQFENLADAETLAPRLAELGGVLEGLRALRDAVAAESRAPEAASRAEALHEDALTALRGGDFAGAERFAESLRQLGSRIRDEYELRVVARPGEQSGVWRIPDRNPDARNYYVIVEGVAPDGGIVAVPVRSEEDGRTSVVRKWGLRVAKEVFERIRADKEDDGIIQNARVGVKRRGNLEPEYTVPVEGGAITSW